MLDPRVIDQRGVKRRAQRKTAELSAGKIVHSHHAATDIRPIDEEHEHIIDAIAIHTFRNGLTQRIADVARRKAPQLQRTADESTGSHKRNRERIERFLTSLRR